MSDNQDTFTLVRALVEDAFDAVGEVDIFGPQGDPTEVAVLTCADAPAAGSQLVSTLTLHRTPNAIGEEDVRVELAGATRTEVDWFAPLLATAAVSVARDGWLAAPGMVFRGMVEAYEPPTPLPHLLLTYPVWDELAQADVTDALTVHWLLAMPISDRELGYLDEYGFAALHELFATSEVSYDNPLRESLV